MPPAWRRASFAALPVAALVAALAPWPPALVERSYASWAYPRIQYVLTSVSNATPFAWLDVLVVSAVGGVLVGTAASWRRRRRLAPWLAAMTWRTIAVAPPSSTSRSSSCGG